MNLSTMKKPVKNRRQVRREEEQEEPQLEESEELNLQPIEVDAGEEQLDDDIENGQQQDEQGGVAEQMEEEINEEEDAEEEEQENPLDNAEQDNLLNGADLQDFKNKQSNRGVCYLSRIPPYMKPNYIRKLLTGYLVERIYLLAESDWTHKNRVRKGGNKKICFRQGWVEFSDKRMAKLAALTLNGQKMVPKKGNFYSEDIWNLKYLAKFKWHHLTERLAHQERLKKERLKVELEQERRVDDFYSQNLAKSKVINGIVQAKQRKGKQVGSHTERQFQQVRLARELTDQ